MSICLWFSIDVWIARELFTWKPLWRWRWKQIIHDNLCIILMQICRLKISRVMVHPGSSWVQLHPADFAVHGDLTKVKLFQNFDFRRPAEVQPEAGYTTVKCGDAKWLGDGSCDRDGKPTLGQWGVVSPCKGWCIDQAWKWYMWYGKCGRRSIHRWSHIVTTWLRFQAVGTSFVKNVGRVAVNRT